VVAHAGRRGGYEPARPLSQVTLAELASAGPRAAGRCRAGDSTCTGRCPLCRAFESARLAAYRDLARVTLDQLAPGSSGADASAAASQVGVAPAVAFVD
jgi:DNA-binding IscR family transcriptional regulator